MLKNKWLRRNVGAIYFIDLACQQARISLSLILAYCVLESLSCLELGHIHRRYLQLFARSRVYTLSRASI